MSDFLNLIDNPVFTDSNEVESFVRKTYENKNKGQTILRDYLDVALRLLIITGFVSIQFRGKVFIYLNIDKEDYIADLLNIPLSFTEEQKENSDLHFDKLETL